MPKKFMQKIHMIQEQIKADQKKIAESKKNKSYDFEIEENISINLKLLEAIFVKTSDVVFREFTIGPKEVEAFIVNIDGLSDKQLVNQSILHPLMWESKKVDYQGSYDIEDLTKNLIDYNEVNIVDTIADVVDGILSGDTVLLVAGSTKAMIAGTRNWEQRGVNQPESESSVRGPREGFTETLRINTSLVRRKIKDPELMFDMLKIGNRTRTDVAVVFIKDIANEKIVAELKKRLESISIDGILESGYIEAFIDDNPLSLFPTTGYTESPDKFAGKILEGRVGILVDGTPFALTVPSLFIESIQVPEDYYQNVFLASFLRFLRIIAIFTSLFLPGIYLAIINFHPSVLPISLLDTIAGAQEGTPFPAFIESLMVLVAFEILREAGLRIPRPVGQAVSIVGALVLGDAAVSAGLASYTVVIIIALSGIMGFLLPPQLETLLILRFPILFFAAIFGLYGVGWFFIMMVIYMFSLRSFGVPYVQPTVMYTEGKVNDAGIRNPWWAMIRRPSMLRPQDSQRVKKGQEPKPNNNDEGSKNEKGL